MVLSTFDHLIGAPSSRSVINRRTSTQWQAFGREATSTADVNLMTIQSPPAASKAGDPTSYQQYLIHLLSNESVIGSSSDTMLWSCRRVCVPHDLGLQGALGIAAEHCTPPG